MSGVRFQRRQQQFKARNNFGSYASQQQAVHRTRSRGQQNLQAARGRFYQGAVSAGRKRQAIAIANAATAGFLAMETKFYDTAIVNTAIAAATDATGGEYPPTLPAGVNCVSTPAQGDGPDNRDGKRIIIKNLSIKGHIIRNATEDAAAPPTLEKVYLAVVLDTQTNGAQTQSELVFKNLAAVAAGNTAPLRNLLYGSRFKILKADVFDLDQTTSAEGDNLHSAPGKSCQFDWYVDLKDLPVNFTAGTTADIANVVDNSITVMAFSSTGSPVLTYNCRIRFQG